MSCASIPVSLLHDLLLVNDLETAIQKLIEDAYKKIPGTESHRLDVYDPQTDINDFLMNLCPMTRQVFVQRKVLHAPDAISLPLRSTKNSILGVCSFKLHEPREVTHQEVVYLETIVYLISLSIERAQNKKRTKSILQELQSSQERLALALQSQKMGVWDWDIPTNKLYWDETMFEVFGIEPQDFTGSFQDWERSIVPEDLEQMTQIIQDVLDNKIDLDHQFRIYRKGEQRYVAGIGTVIRDEYGQPLRFTGLNWDVTEKVLANKKLEQERAKSIANSKMASLGEMASGIAHEINNPLTIILNRMDQLKVMLSKPGADMPTAIKEIDKIESTFERIAKIIRGLKAFSRNADNDPMISCDLNSIVDETLELCLERFKTHGVEIKTSGLHHLMYLSCRPSQISQVLLNLLNNSFDAISQSQAPWIHIDVRLLTEKMTTYIQLNVTDSGKGIPQAIADKMMDPFFTTKDVGQGTGLGLPISKGIIEDHSGNLWLDRESENTRFVIELPLEELVARPKGPRQENLNLEMNAIN